MIKTSHKKLSGVYILNNENSGRVYIGSSVDIVTRITNHFRDLKSNRHANKELQKDYNNGDLIKPYYYRLYPVNNKNFLFSEEGKTIEYFKQNNYNLYNKGKLTTNHFITRELLKDYMVDAYCKEKFGCSFLQLTALCVPAEFSMYRDFLLYPDKKEEIKDNYHDVIDYQRKERYYKTHPKVKRKNFMYY